VPNESGGSGIDSGREKRLRNLMSQENGSQGNVGGPKGDEKRREIKRRRENQGKERAKQGK